MTRTHGASRTTIHMSPLAHAQSRQATAVAHPNIALVKYWGKRQGPGNLPAVGSLSITLDTLETRTRVCFDATASGDTLSLGGAPAPDGELRRVSAFLDLVRQRAGVSHRARVESRNNFPTGAGLASSASGFAALAVAATHAAGLRLSAAELSILARQGSGSAARSIFGGFAAMARGEAADGHDAVAAPLLAADAWPLAVLVAITSTAQKSVGSTEGMERTRHTAPFYAPWLDTQEADLAEARGAIAARDFAALAAIAEHSCMKMHGLMLAARPSLVYWNPTTLAALQEVIRLRDAGTPVFFTIDAGPQVKAVCLPEARGRVQATLAALPGVQQVLVAGLGPGAHLVEDAW
jgi:diphosphomevalonate decarboxylase